MTRLHYTMCGLDDVYLLDGFSYEETSRGRMLRVEAQGELHKAIGRWLVQLNRGLTGKELRFLREEVNLSQANLARLLGESDQSVARREKRDDPFKQPTTQERVLRYLYNQNVLETNETLCAFLNAMADADNRPRENVEFEPSDDGKWHEAA